MRTTHRLLLGAAGGAILLWAVLVMAASATDTCYRSGGKFPDSVVGEPGWQWWPTGRTCRFDVDDGTRRVAFGSEPAAVGDGVIPALVVGIGAMTVAVKANRRPHQH